MKNNIIEVGIEPKEHCLFHYEKQPEYFFDMLRHGSQLANNWKVGDSNGFVKSDDEIHNLSEPFRLKLKTNQIENVIVPNTEHLENVKREFPDLSDKVRTWDDLFKQANS